ncbi:polysaccharide pyruvyl transferase CsaB [Natranaerovirga pectinivora]|uniref:Polysaccharide pyruvyl transferase CsaB n=1 Tax=Natranaerovirga pectinivora TaxID=682400 RepID=A0A4V2V059_9FIRM|nr:polysaccharide pyruvyl transferase CsaB [Natranaerovirga pectinivora]TCT14111.1 polysaccharide pyruvyl transferase CsaB [Natranaerovirga pectinivora]
MTKILISGYLGFDNSGDESILQAISTSIKESELPIEITALSSNPRKTAKNHQINSLHSFNPFSVLKGILRSDIIISGGGNLLQDKTSSKSLWYYIFIIFLGKVFRKKVMLYSNGVGPLDKKINKKIVKKVINKVDVITLREKLSKEMLIDIGVTNPPIHITADPVFLLKPSEEARIKKILEQEGIQNNKKNIGISVRKWGNENQVKEFAGFCDDIVKNNNMNIVFIPMQYPQDLIVSEQILENMKEKAKIISKHYSSNDQIGIIKEMDIILSMRLHTLIYAGIVSVPMVGIVYDPKIEYYLNQVGMPSIKHIENLSYEEIKSHIINIYNDYEINKKQLGINSKVLKRKAKTNNDYLFNLIKSN